MKKAILILFVLGVAVLLVGQGCIKEKETGQKTPTGTTAQEDINSVEQDINSVEQSDAELNMSDLDNLDSELDEINW